MNQANSSLQFHSAGPGQPLCISGHADIYQAAELHTRLCLYLADSDQPCIDLAGLLSCDVLTLQLLFAADRRVPAERRAPLFRSLPGCVMERCGELGLPLLSASPSPIE